MSEGTRVESSTGSRFSARSTTINFRKYVGPTPPSTSCGSSTHPTSSGWSRWSTSSWLSHSWKENLSQPTTTAWLTARASFRVSPSWTFPTTIPRFSHAFWWAWLWSLAWFSSRHLNTWLSFWEMIFYRMPRNPMSLNLTVMRISVWRWEEKQHGGSIRKSLLRRLMTTALKSIQN